MSEINVFQDLSASQINQNYELAKVKKLQDAINTTVTEAFVVEGPQYDNIKVGRNINLVSSALNQDNVVIGNDITCTGENGVIIGDGVYNAGNNNTVVGADCVCTGSLNRVFGMDNQCTVPAPIGADPANNIIIGGPIAPDNLLQGIDGGGNNVGGQNILFIGTQPTAGGNEKIFNGSICLTAGGGFVPADDNRLQIGGDGVPDVDAGAAFPAANPEAYLKIYYKNVKYRIPMYTTGA